MKKDISHNHVFTQWKKIVFFALTLLILLPLSACKKQTDYFSFVSELRSNLLLAECEDFSLRIYAVEREQPYSADGVKRETASRTEFYLTAPSGDKDCAITFTLNGELHQAELSFDNVKAEYYYYCPLNLADINELVCQIDYGEQAVTLHAKTVKTANTLTPLQALQAVFLKI